MLAGDPATVSHKLTMHQSIQKNGDIGHGLVVPVYVYFHSSIKDLFLLRIIEVRGRVLCLFFLFLSTSLDTDILTKYVSFIYEAFHHINALVRHALHVKHVIHAQLSNDTACLFILSLGLLRPAKPKARLRKCAICAASP